MTSPKLSYYRRDGEIPLLEQTIPACFASISSRFPAQEALVSIPQQCRLSYQQLAAKIDQLARGLMSAGFSRGERIGIWSTNNIEWVLVQMACARIGAVLVNINPAYQADELHYALQRSEVQGLFTIPSFRRNNYLTILKKLIPELTQIPAAILKAKEFPHLRKIILYEPRDPLHTPKTLPGLTTWQEIITKAPKTTPEELEQICRTLHPDAPANIQYTSGTTGFPKAVVLTHRAILNNGYFTGLAMHMTPRDRLCVSVPFYHCFGTVLVNLLCFSHGSCVVIACDHFNAYQVLKAVEKEKCTALHGVPTMFIAELELPQFSDINTSSLRTGIMAGAPCPPPLMQRVIKEMHCREILIGYGQTEASPLTHLTSKDDSFQRRIETVGRNLPHQEVKIINPENGKTLPLNQSGEICFKGYHLMRGYHGDPEATHKAIDQEGWLHSGDLGAMDKDGYLRITGRLKNMIIRGGENIYPKEIEECIFSHPKVAEVAVFGIPDDYWGEEIMAWIKLKTNNTATKKEIRNFCQEKLAHFKIPRFIWFVKKFPMTVTGKLQKFKMRELALKKT